MLSKNFDQRFPTLRLRKETYALELFRRGKLTHFELSKVLSLDGPETDAYLKQHGVFEGSLTGENLEADRQTLERLLRPIRP
jgi:hypothetical protein